MLFNIIGFLMLETKYLRFIGMFI